MNQRAPLLAGVSRPRGLQLATRQRRSTQAPHAWPPSLVLDDGDPQLCNLRLTWLTGPAAGPAAIVLAGADPAPKKPDQVISAAAKRADPAGPGPFVVSKEKRSVHQTAVAGTAGSCRRTREHKKGATSDDGPRWSKPLKDRLTRHARPG